MDKLNETEKTVKQFLEFYGGKNKEEKEKFFGFFRLYNKWNILADKYRDILHTKGQCEDANEALRKRDAAMQVARTYLDENGME